MISDLIQLNEKSRFELNLRNSAILNLLRKSFTTHCGPTKARDINLYNCTQRYPSDLK